IQFGQVGVGNRADITLFQSEGGQLEELGSQPKTLLVVPEHEALFFECMQQPHHGGLVDRGLGREFVQGCWLPGQLTQQVKGAEQDLAHGVVLPPVPKRSFPKRPALNCPADTRVADHSSSLHSRMADSASASGSGPRSPVTVNVQAAATWPRRRLAFWSRPNSTPLR